ncbi:unnamed protein product [Moneuplotes crassus]|uniref:Smr domain-containing protein n=1 Tax=Euplotes crassus TaxID=5936 RepID=A0AAD1UFC5_EUPCR|nr:unnamed protein product [Moneuplotes crassus]
MKYSFSEKVIKKLKEENKEVIEIEDDNDDIMICENWTKCSESNDTDKDSVHSLSPPRVVPTKDIHQEDDTYISWNDCPAAAKFPSCVNQNFKSNKPKKSRKPQKKRDRKMMSKNKNKRKFNNYKKQKINSKTSWPGKAPGLSIEKVPTKRDLTDGQFDAFFKDSRKEIFKIQRYINHSTQLINESKEKQEWEMCNYYEGVKKVFLDIHNKVEAEAIKQTLEQKNKNGIKNCIDLHGLKKNEALKVLTIVISNLCNSKQKNSQIEYTVITGRGNHSKDGPVLKPAVEQFLKDCRIPYREISSKGGYTFQI